MTEAEWLACEDPRKMLEALRGIAATHEFTSCSCLQVRCLRGAGFCPAYRKLRLFTLDCCLRLWPLLPHPVCGAAIQALGRYIEGERSEADFSDAVAAFDTARRQRFPKYETPDDGAWNALYCSVHRRWTEEFDEWYAERRWEIADTVALDAVRSAGEAERLAQATGCSTSSATRSAPSPSPRRGVPTSC
jgi:hypothetical protein